MDNDSSSSKQSVAESLWRELLVFCISDALSKEGLCEIIERHVLTPDNDYLTIRDSKFFFGACVNERVTEEIIQYLLEYFPAAASATIGSGGARLSILHAKTQM